ncbi:MAG: hypothetical protein ACKVKG_15665, partial [Alphaproteobacteria bacterium]
SSTLNGSTNDPFQPRGLSTKHRVSDTPPDALFGDRDPTGNFAIESVDQKDHAHDFRVPAGNL